MQLPLTLDGGADTSLQLQIVEQIRRLIAEGRLHPGVRLPASRSLAADLGISRNTVALAYERLGAEGFIEMRPPVGTFVARNPVLDGPATEPDGVAAPAPARTALQQRIVFRGEPHAVVPQRRETLQHDFWVGRSDARLFPAKAWRHALREVLRQRRTDISGYCNPAGLPDLRRAVADYVGVARGIRTRAEQVLVTGGIQQGLNILARLFVTRDSVVAVEDPGYLGGANLFESYGARLRPVPVDDAGIDPGALPHDATLLYLTPSHQYPTGATLPMERRERVLDWARRRQAWVVEDDYDSDFYYDSAPLPALKSLDADDQVIYLGTFSKSLAAGLRIGYMVLPECLVERAVTVKTLMDNCSPWLPQKVLADFVASGAFAHHLRRIRVTCRARRDRLLAELRRHFGTVDVRGSQGGMHVLWRLPVALPAAADIEREARRRGVGVYSLASCNVRCGDRDEHGFAHSLLLGYAALDEAEITTAIARLAAAIAAAGAPATAD